MSAIDYSGNGLSGSSKYQGMYEAQKAAKNTSSSQPSPTASDISMPTFDTVDISPEAKTMSMDYISGRSTLERSELADSVRAKLQTLVKSRRDLDGQINAVLKEAGIKLADGEKLRIETTSGGKIKVGGIEDKEKRKKIEDALNNEAGLGAKVQKHNATQRKLSSELKADTGLSLSELILEAKGERTNDGGMTPLDETSTTIGLNKGLEQFQLFNDNSDLAGLVGELGESSNISLCSDSKAAAEPESTLKKLMSDAHAKVAEAFDAKNEDMRLKFEKAGVKMSEEDKKAFFLDVKNVSIQVGSDGSIEIEGDAAGDSVIDKEGKEIIKSVMEEMMKATNESGDVVLFAEAASRLLDDYELAFEGDAAEDARVMMAVGKGHVGVETRLSSPSKEAELDEAINVQANELIADMVDFDVETPFEVSLDKNGKLTIDNLPEDDIQRKQVLQALEIVNNNIKTEDENDETYGELIRNVNHRRTFMVGGLDVIYDNEKNEKPGETTATDYNGNLE